MQKVVMLMMVVLFVHGKVRQKLYKIKFLSLSGHNGLNALTMSPYQRTLMFPTTQLLHVLGKKNAFPVLALLVIIALRYKSSPPSTHLRVLYC
jgi:hypothetical protein